MAAEEARAADGAGDRSPAAPRAELRPWLILVLLAAAFAVPAAVVAGLFLVVVRVLTDLAWTRLPEALSFPAPAVLLAVPILGSLVVGLIVRYAPGRGGPDPAAETVAADTGDGRPPSAPGATGSSRSSARCPTGAGSCCSGTWISSPA